MLVHARRSGIVLLAALLVAAGSAAVAQPARAEGSGVSVVGGGGTASAGAPAQQQQPRSRLSPQTRAAPATTPPGDYVRGIDVASYQGNVVWSKARASGVRFVYAKATEGTGYTNPFFDQQYGGAKRAGLYAGAYAFARPDGNATAQARYFYAHAQYVRDSKTLPLMLDMEGPYPSLPINDLCWNKSTSQMIAWIRAFVTEVERLSGSRVTIYTNKWWWQQCTGDTTQFANQYLNIANWSSTDPPLPGGWQRWTFWQYSSQGRVPGIVGNVDLDVFNGSLRQLQQLTQVSWARSGVSAVRTGSGYHVFGHNSSGQLLQAVWTGSRWLVQNLGGVSNGTPASTYRAGRYDVFAVSPGGSLYQKTYSDHWGNWHRIATGWARSGVSAVRTGSGYHVFGHNSSGQLLQAVWTGSRWLVQNLGGVSNGTPASTYRAGRYDVFAVSPGGSLYQKTYSDHWGNWHRIA